MTTRVNEHKLQIGSCAACGRRVLPGTSASRYEHCCQFDWDHQKRKLKIKAISKLIADHSSLSKIWEEIKKCLLVCANCHVLKSRCRRLTKREKKVFKTLKIGHSKDIDPYDGLNYFFQPTALYQYQLGIDFDMRENQNWNRPDESFFVPILPPLPVGHSSGFSQICVRKNRPAFRLQWQSTSGVRRSEPFAVSDYDGDRETALGAALARREELRASGTPFKLYEEDTEKKEQFISKYRQFLARQGSSPAPAASSSSPVPAASSSLSFLEEAQAHLALSELLLAQFQALDRRACDRKRAAAEEESHPPKRRRRLH